MKLRIFKHNTGNQGIYVDFINELYLIRVMFMDCIYGLLRAVFMSVASSRSIQVYFIQDNSRSFYNLNELSS